MLALIKDGKVETYPLTNIQALFPYTSFALPITADQLPDDVVEVISTPTIENPDEANYNVIEDTPVLNNGSYKQVWKLTEKDPSEKAQYRQQKIESARAQRNALLAQCDWTQTEDAPVDKEAWRIYRQALRDISNQPEFPFNITWPDKP